jgi:outer membrane biogenesis lipoprotein LolB
MERGVLVITLLAATAFLVGCKKEQTPAQQLDKVQADTKQATQDMKDYSQRETAAKLNEEGEDDDEDTSRFVD